MRRSSLLQLALLTALGCHGGQRPTPPEPKRLSSDGQRTCLVADDGGIDCWGASGDWGGDVRPMTEPVTSLELDRSGEDCAITQAGEVVCWVPGLIEPRTIASLTGALELGNSCAVDREGRLRCWHDDDTLDRFVGLGRVVEVDEYGYNGRCVRNLAGKVYCWRYADDVRRRVWGFDAIDIAGHRGSIWIVRPDGHVIDPQLDSRYASIIEVVGIDDAVEVDGESSACARRSTGAVACWNSSEWAASPLFPDWQELGTFRAVDVPGIEDAVEILVVDDFACARERAGGVRCWGDNSNFQLGDPVAGFPVEQPTRVAGIADAVAVAVGWTHACAVDAERRLWCWGQRGRFDPQHPSVWKRGGPTMIAEGVDGARLSAAMTCERRGAGVLNCWGVLGDAWKWTAGSLELAPDTSMIALGSDWGCGAGPQGIQCFDMLRNFSGGDGDSLRRLRGHDGLTSVTLADASGVIVDFDVGDHQACSVLDSGAVHCFAAGVLSGDAEPRIFGGLPALREVAVASDRACGLTEEGEAWCWDLDGRSPPARVDGLPPVARLDSGRVQTCGLDRQRARLWCWARDTQPVMVAELEALRDFDIGWTSACVVERDGQVACWGDNEWGQSNPASPMFSTTALPVAPERMRRVAGPPR